MAKKKTPSYKDIETSLEIFKERQIPASEVGFCILKAFGKSDADIRRYREKKGILKSYNGLLIKGLFCYKEVATIAMTSTLEEIKCDPQVIKAKPKIIAVSDGKTILAYDMREYESYENPLEQLYCDFLFLYPLCGVERFKQINENPADVKAAEKLAKLHDALRAYNDFSSKSELHDLNLFIARLLFCFFAEDTGIFEKNLFTGSIARYTQEDGSDLADYLSAAFNVMDISERNADTRKIITQFPYVNGGLFSKHIQIPKIGRKARDIIIECGDLNWQDINPDIFGSMIQAVVNPNLRADQGIHYTSVPNIMKVINPLFLDELRGEYQKQRSFFDEKKRMREVGMLSQNEFFEQVKPIIKENKKLLQRISKMKFFDPACGSGNFLIITYKTLRSLEMDILRLNRQCHPQGELEFLGGSCITLQQFYGIELLDFPHEVAMLSMWIAEHQMNKKLNDDFEVNTCALPLHTITQIQCGNACRLDWNTVCPHEKEDEVFVFGNPPYLGSRNQKEDQKKDMDYVFSDFLNISGYRKLDYVSCWFYKAAKFMYSNYIKCAFVSTNSIISGEQKSIMWDNLFRFFPLEIFFAYSVFKWKNNAKDKAAVSVIILGISNKSNSSKILFTEEKEKIKKRIVEFISPSLNESIDRHVKKATQSISNLPKIRRGNMPNDKEFLRLSAIEKKNIINEYPSAQKFIRLQIGADEFINGIEKYCYWISNDDYHEALQIPQIKNAIENVHQYRINSRDKTLHNQAKRPHQMREFYECNENSLLIPIVSSENRVYIPIGFVPDKTIIPNSAQVIYKANFCLFSIITSKMHMLWTKYNAGRLDNRIRYSCFLCYNTFPFPKITKNKRTQLANAAEEVLLARADFPEKNLAELYDPDKMPQNLREAHAALDDLVDSCYPGYPFADDEARLECLFKLYEKMTAQ